MSLIRLEKVTKSYAGSQVLADVNLRVEAGEHIGLIGRIRDREIDDIPLH